MPTRADKQRIAELLREHPHESASQIAARAGVTGKAATLRKLVSRVRAQLHTLTLPFTHRQEIAATSTPWSTIEHGLRPVGTMGGSTQYAPEPKLLNAAPAEPAPAPRTEASREYFDMQWMRGAYTIREDEGWKLVHSYKPTQNYKRRFTTVRIPINDQPHHVGSFMHAYDIYDRKEKVKA